MLHLEHCRAGRAPVDLIGALSHHAEALGQQTCVLLPDLLCETTMFHSEAVCTASAMESSNLTLGLLRRIGWQRLPCRPAGCSCHSSLCSSVNEKPPPRPSAAPLLRERDKGYKFDKLNVVKNGITLLTSSLSVTSSSAEHQPSPGIMCREMQTCHLTQMHRTAYSQIHACIQGQ